MGNTLISVNSDSSKMNDCNQYTPVDQFKFIAPFLIPDEDSTNGLCFNDIYLPEEIVSNILRWVPPREILPLSLVCKTWCNIIKSDIFWLEIHKRQHPKKPCKKLPWYVYFSYYTTDNFTNLIKNNNGQDGYKHWKILSNGGDGFRIEDPPAGADPLPTGVTDFNGRTSCFAASYGVCSKRQEILLAPKRLLRYIIDRFTPDIVVSEWTAGRFDCGCIYELRVIGYCDQEMANVSNCEVLFDKQETVATAQWQGSKWQKVKIIVSKYPKRINKLEFEHKGQDTQFWAGHYGSKMAGGVLLFDLDSIEPVEEEQKEENIIL